MGYDPNVGPPNSPTMAKTTDGGAHWSTVTAPGIAFPGSMSCPTTTMCATIVGSAVSSAAVSVTTDGGANWTTSSDTTLYGVDCASATVCAAVGDKTIKMTTDAGAHWMTPPGIAPPDYRVSGDVSVTYDTRGHAILCYIAFDKLGTFNYWAHGAMRNGIFIRRSLDEEPQTEYHVQEFRALALRR